VRYDFEYTNPNNQLLRLGSEIVSASNAKIRWKKVQDNIDYFREDVAPKETSKLKVMLIGLRYVNPKTSV